jgi:Na+/proline symporter
MEKHFANTLIILVTWLYVFFVACMSLWFRDAPVAVIMVLILIAQTVILTNAVRNWRKEHQE